MSPSVHWVQRLNSCVRLMRSRTIGATTVSRRLHNKSWFISAAGKRFENAKLMRQNAVQATGSVRRFDDRYRSSNFRSNKPPQSGRGEDEDVNLRTNFEYDNYVRKDKRHQVPTMRDVESYDGNFDPRFDDRLYKTFNRDDQAEEDNEIVPRQQSRPTSDYSMDDVPENTPHWVTWEGMPNRRPEEGPSFNRQSYSDLYNQWRNRSEPDRQIRSPKETERAFQPLSPVNYGGPEETARPVLNWYREQLTEEAIEATERSKSKSKDRKKKRVPQLKNQLNDERYWHRWDNCPDERKIVAKAADDDTDESEEYENYPPEFYTPPGNQNYRVQKPPKFDGSRRRYQTMTHPAETRTNTSISDFNLMDIPPKSPWDRLPKKKVAPPRYTIPLPTRVRRKLNGYDKQIHTRFNTDDTHHHDTDTTLNKASPTITDNVIRSQYLSEQQCAQGSCRRARRRFLNKESKSDAMATPKFQMTIKRHASSSKRCSVPIASFSERFKGSLHDVPPNYVNFGRTSVCDSWNNFLDTQKY